MRRGSGRRRRWTAPASRTRSRRRGSGSGRRLGPRRRRSRARSCRPRAARGPAVDRARPTRTSSATAPRCPSSSRVDGCTRMRSGSARWRSRSRAAARSTWASDPRIGSERVGIDLQTLDQREGLEQDETLRVRWVHEHVDVARNGSAAAYRDRRGVRPCRRGRSARRALAGRRANRAPSSPPYHDARALLGERLEGGTQRGLADLGRGPARAGRRGRTLPPCRRRPRVGRHPRPGSRPGRTPR